MNIKTNKYLQIGLMVIVSLATFIWGFNFLKGRNILNPSNEYYLAYPEITGLMESDPVLIRGLKIGQVSSIHFDPNKPENILIRIILEKDINIPTDSKIILGSISMLGSKGIRLEIGESTLYYTTGDTIVGTTEIDLLNKFNDEIGPIKTKSELILSRIDTITGSVNSMLSAQAIADIHQTIHYLKLTTQEIASSRAAISETMESINLMVATLAEERETIASILQNIDSITNPALYSKMMASIEGTMNDLNQLTTTLNSEDGSLQKLMTDPELYDNLTATSHNADLLLQDMRNYPNRYVQFSLFNNGKSTYLTKEGVTKKMSEYDDVAFRILVKKAKNPVVINADNFVDPTTVSEFEYKGTYYYYVGEYMLYQDADEMLVKVSEQYPNAKMLVLKKGKPVPIEKVLK